MPLVEEFQDDPERILSRTLQQIVTWCGDGRLTDGSECSAEFRDVISVIPSEKLFEFISTCLEERFDRSGMVLQDLVNELGKRLDFRVEHGLYQGRSGAIGFDGVWTAPDGFCIVIEVKTTDAYRINLDSIASYRDRLIDAGRISERSSILIVVGRQDTGDLEAQVRGSKHAWDVRLISVDALNQLVKLKEETEEDTTAKIHELLIPFEYTKLDKIIDITFTAAADAGFVVQEGFDLDGPRGGNAQEDATFTQQRTPREELDAIRRKIVLAIGVREGSPLVRRSAATYWSSDSERRLRVICSISKRYERGLYWYGYHQKWDRFLSDGTHGYLVLGCVGLDKAFALPYEWIQEKLPRLYTTGTGDSAYWHIELEEGDAGEPHFLVRTEGERILLSDFALSIGS